MATEEARYCENSLMLYGQREKSSGSFDFALEDLDLDKAWRRCAQDDRDKHFV